VADSNNTSSPATASSLEVVARHEQKLLDSIAEAERDAVRIVAEARRNGDMIVEEKQNALHQEAERIRTDAANQRDEERAAILGEANKRIKAARAGVEGELAAAAEDLIALVMPKTAPGGAS
jgi:vacuolar-type H+-ATPase subunit H